MRAILIIANVFNDAMRIVKGKIFHGETTPNFDRALHP